MATATASPQVRRRARPLRTLPPRHPLPPQTRDQRLAEARAREVRARHALAHALASMNRAQLEAEHDLEVFEARLSEVRKRLRREGYLRDRSPAG